MTPGQPPKFAAWLLQNFGSGADNDAVLGDLAERYGEGKRPWWYWKQTLIAIAVSSFEDIRARRILAFRALFAGCLVQAGIELLIACYFPLVPYWVPLNWWGTGLETVIASAFAVLLGSIVGVTIVRLYRGRRGILLFYIAIVQAAGALTAVLSGNGPTFYLVASISLTLGILAGGLWSSRTYMGSHIASR